jgi:hypothetical protein
MTCSRLSIAASRPVGVLGRVRRATGLEEVDGLGARRPQIVERGTLGIGGLHDLGNALDRIPGDARASNGGIRKELVARMTTALPRRLANYVVWRDGLVGYGSHGGSKMP